MLTPDWQTKFARDRAEPPVPCWQVLDGPVPAGGRALSSGERERLRDHGLRAGKDWELRAANYDGTQAHLLMPAGERRLVRFAVRLVVAL